MSSPALDIDRSSARQGAGRPSTPVPADAQGSGLEASTVLTNANGNYRESAEMGGAPSISMRWILRAAAPKSPSA